MRIPRDSNVVPSGACWGSTVVKLRNLPCTYKYKQPYTHLYICICAYIYIQIVADIYIYNYIHVHIFSTKELHLSLQAALACPFGKAVLALIKAGALGRRADWPYRKGVY